MPWIDPIYDRTNIDVSTRTSKGFFNVADFMRIVGNTVFLKNLTNTLRELSLTSEETITPTTSTIPTADEINVLVRNLEIIRIAIALPSGLGVVPLLEYLEGIDGDSPIYTDINAWEKNLQFMLNFLVAGSYYMPMCGIGAVGQTYLWQVRFRRIFYPESATPVRRPRAGIAAAGRSMERQNNFRRYDT
jgi:hypothetical protein